MILCIYMILYVLRLVDDDQALMSVHNYLISYLAINIMTEVGNMEVATVLASYDRKYVLLYSYIVDKALKDYNTFHYISGISILVLLSELLGKYLYFYQKMCKVRHIEVIFLQNVDNVVFSYCDYVRNK